MNFEERYTIQTFQIKSRSTISPCSFLTIEGRMVQETFSSEPQQVGSSRAARDIQESYPLAEENEINGDDVLLHGQSDSRRDFEMGTSAAHLTDHGLYGRAMKKIKAAGRLFNILDRIRKKNNQNASYLQQGASFDGVFSNLSAKPDCEGNNTSEQDHPPTYDEAATDMAPSYYGVDDDSGLYGNEICIEGLPVGNIANLIWNIVVSSSFQFIGFLITYILHTSHAAKQGSRFGLGLTFIGYSYSMIPNDVTAKVGKDKQLDKIELQNPNEHDNLNPSLETNKQDDYISSLSTGIDPEKQDVPVMAIAIGVLGGFIILKSIYDYIKVKKMERKYQSQDAS